MILSDSPTSGAFASVREPKFSQKEVWRKYHAAAEGDSAEEDIVKKYSHLVKTVVGKLAMNLPSHVDLDDLQSAGMLGLLNAVRNYKPEIGSPFEAYARLRIRGQLGRRPGAMAARSSPAPRGDVTRTPSTSGIAGTSRLPPAVPALVRRPRRGARARC